MEFLNNMYIVESTLLIYCKNDHNNYSHYTHIQDTVALKITKKKSFLNYNES